MKHISLGELSLKIGVNKSRLAYFFTIGLLKPIAKVGKMNIFDEDETKKTLKKIEALKKKGMKLKEIIIEINK